MRQAIFLLTATIISCLEASAQVLPTIAQDLEPVKPIVFYYGANSNGDLNTITSDGSDFLFNRTYGPSGISEYTTSVNDLEKLTGKRWDFQYLLGFPSVFWNNTIFTYNVNSKKLICFSDSFHVLKESSVYYHDSSSSIVYWKSLGSHMVWKVQLEETPEYEYRWKYIRPGMDSAADLNYMYKSIDALSVRDDSLQFILHHDSNDFLFCINNQTLFRIEKSAIGKFLDYQEFSNHQYYFFNKKDTLFYLIFNHANNTLELKNLQILAHNQSIQSLTYTGNLGLRGLFISGTFQPAPSNPSELASFLLAIDTNGVPFIHGGINYVSNPEYNELMTTDNISPIDDEYCFAGYYIAYHTYISKNGWVPGFKMNVYKRRYTLLTETISAGKQNPGSIPSELYPNPAHHTIIVTPAPLSYDIIKYTGKKIQSGLKYSHNIDISDIESGIYFLQLNYANNISVVRLFVKI